VAPSVLKRPANPYPGSRGIGGQFATTDEEMVDMADDGVDASEATFSMKPVIVIEQLARHLVRDQRAIAEMRHTVESLPADAPDDEVGRARAIVDEHVGDWTRTQLPVLAASFRLALEVLDTYGPEGVHVGDATEAAIWNNKYFVWLREFGGV
jgi:hypothetical protein